jgi:nucleoside-diphosphate-sugar epimerase
MRILLTGVDGYIGWPLALKLSKEFREAEIFGIDNLGRRKWVEEVGSRSVVPILTVEEKIKAAEEGGFDNIRFIYGDLIDKDFVNNIVKTLKPDIILHLAAQPSAPYSQINMDRAYYTQKNNILGTLNLLWALRENGFTDTHFIETTTTGIYGAPNINIGEGFVKVLDDDGNEDILPFPNIATSWYHVTKGFDAANIWLMNFQTGMPCTDVRTSIVYGVNTEETKRDERLLTRFDIDFYFGTLYNRWCSMIILNKPLTVYGSGNQIKPFISLEDCCRSLVEIVKRGNSGDYKVYNQLTEYVIIKEFAEELNKKSDELFGKSPGIDFIPNPRKEKEESEYKFKNDEFIKLLDNKYTKMYDELKDTLEVLDRYRKTIEGLSGRLLSK